MAIEGFRAARPRTGAGDGGRLLALEAGRAFAAIFVVLYHAHYQSVSRAYEAPQTWNGFEAGASGVEFFFVLSGFIMVHVNRGRFGAANGLKHFLWSRFVRIYPVYWCVLVPLLLLYVVGGRGPEFATDPWVGFGQFLLLPLDDHMILTVAWTLSHEILFYLMFSLLFIARTAGAAILAIWFAACAAFPFSGAEGGAAGFVFSHYNLLFLFGILAALSYSEIPLRMRAPLAGLGLVLFLGVGQSAALGLRSWSPEMLTVAFGITAAVLVASLAGCAACSKRVPRVLVFLGAASYSIYLVHFPVMNILGRIMASTPLPDMLSPTAALWLLALAGVAAGVGMHLVIEKPLLRWIKDLRATFLRAPA